MTQNIFRPGYALRRSVLEPRNTLFRSALKPAPPIFSQTESRALACTKLVRGALRYDGRLFGAEAQQAPTG